MEKKKISEDPYFWNLFVKIWKGIIRIGPKDCMFQKIAEKIQKLVKELGSQKALASKYCFKNIPDSPLNQISTENLIGVLELDRENRTVTVGSGAKYGDFAPELHEKGYALHNLASLPHISVAGACARATHGSRVKNGNLTTGAAAIELVNGNGEITVLKEGSFSCWVPEPLILLLFWK